MNFADLYKKLQAIEENTVVDAGIEECGDMMPGQPRQQDNVTMNVSMNGSGKGGIKDLMAILKNIEDNGPTPGHSDHDMIVGMEDFKNSMAGASGQHTMGIDAVTATGDDLASKGGEAPKVNGGGNPMQEEIAQRLQKMYETIKEDGGYDAMGYATTAEPSASPVAVAKPAAPTQAAKPVRAAAKPDPNVMALQQKLIAAGAKIKADGIMGPATRAAQQQFPNVTTQTDAEKAVSADYLSANDAGRNPNAGLTPDDPRWQGAKPAAAPAAPAATPAAPAPAKAADGGPPPTPEQLKWLGGADPTDPIILARMRKAVPNAAAPAAAAPAPAAPAPTAESVTFGQDPALARIVQLARR